MSTKVVSVRLPIVDIIGGVDILSASGVTPDNMSLSAIVRIVFHSAIAQQVDKGAIKLRSLEEAQKILEDWHKKDVPLDGNILSKGLADYVKEAAQEDSTPPEEESPKKELSPSAHTIALEVAKKLDAEIEEVVVIKEEVESSVTDRSALFKLNFLSMDEIREQSPKDRIILQFDEQREDVAEDQIELFERCIGVIYASVPIEKWGLETTQDMIQDLYDDFS